MSHLWSDQIHQLEPYVAGEQPKEGTYIRLNTNEAAFAPSPKVLTAISQAVGERLRLYPNLNADTVRAAAAQYYGIQADQVFVGNGSDDVLANIFLSYFRHAGKKILFPDITYSFYEVYANLYQVPAERIPLKDDFTIDLQPYQQVSSDQYCGIIIANPNAPTGIALSRHELECLLQAQPNMVVVVDEAYVDFGAQSCVTLINQYPQLIVVQTLSKSRALAGLRIGFAFAQSATLEAMFRVKDSINSYPVDQLAQVAATAAWQDEAYFQQTTRTVIANRQLLVQGLERLGFQVLPSATNFVLATHPACEARHIQQQLRHQGILVRHFNRPRIANFLRITVGSQAECERLLDNLCGIINQ